MFLQFCYAHILNNQNTENVTEFCTALCCNMATHMYLNNCFKINEGESGVKYSDVTKLNICRLNHTDYGIIQINKPTIVLNKVSLITRYYFCKNNIYILYNIK